MAKLENKRIVITGSSRGLGRAFAIGCAAQGAQVVINGTNLEALGAVEKTIKDAGGKVVSVPGSVAEEATAIALVAACVDNYGGIDVMVNNAGIVRDRTLLKMTTHEFDDVIAVSLRGAFTCTKHAALAMQEHGGHIIQIISASGLSGGFGQGNYAAAKAGMMGLMRTAVMEFRSMNIRCNAMWPVAETDMTQVVFDRVGAAAEQKGENAPSPAALGFGKPDEVAQGLIWLSSDDAKHLNGQCLSFNGRRTALWTHPKEEYLQFNTQAMSIEEINAHFAGAELLPINHPKLSQ